MPTYWLSYGGGVNSTALAILLCEGGLPRYQPWRCVWADTGDEKDETYSYIEHIFRPYLARHGRDLEVVRDRETVLERWERLGVVGSRVLRTCTSHAKIRPIEALKRAEGSLSDPQLIGIDSGERQRARPSLSTDPYPKVYPLVDLGIDRTGCRRITEAAGLCVPVKSGCWHCPFLRKRDVLDLARHRPDRFQRIIELEEASKLVHPLEPGKVRAQWHERPACEWLKLARAESAQRRLWAEEPEESLPCGCYDG